MLSFSVDATSSQTLSLARLVNDSSKSQANSKVKKVVVDGVAQLYLFATKEIKEQDEITYDYGDGQLEWRSKVSSQSRYF
jgi:SET domain-containing protein